MFHYYFYDLHFNPKLLGPQGKEKYCKYCKNVFYGYYKDEFCSKRCKTRHKRDQRKQYLHRR